MIYHIYWGTSGNSGLYLDEIYQVLGKQGFTQKAFVNYYYPFDYGEKIFFKRGDVAMSKYRGVLRRLFQLQEIFCGYVKILIASIKDKPVLINYSHVGQSYFFVVWFLYLLKKLSGAKLMITCHDVNPHSNGCGEMNNRYKIFHTGDYLLVHTPQSVCELNEIFGISKSRILIHPFPIMDLSKLTSEGPNPYNETDFLFIGHLRKDKGIEFLLDSWPKLHKLIPNAKLRICGRYLPDVHFEKNLLEKCNVEFNLHYISDDDYYYYIKSARYVILPYLQGTNSGIISTVLSLGTEVITSDLPMFIQNPLVSKDNTFHTADSASLVRILKEKYYMSSNNASEKLINYKKYFSESVIRVYNKIFTEIDVKFDHPKDVVR